MRVDKLISQVEVREQRRAHEFKEELKNVQLENRFVSHVASTCLSNQ